MNTAILACQNNKDESYFGCLRCLKAFDKREGEFECYKDKPDVRQKAILHCGGCPGTAPVNHLANFKTRMAPLGETIDAIHIGTCLIKNYPYKDSILANVKERAGVEIIEGSYYYAPPKIFGS